MDSALRAPTWLVYARDAAGTRLVSCSDHETRDQKAPRIETTGRTANLETPDVDGGDRGGGAGRLRRLANVERRLRRETADDDRFFRSQPGPEASRAGGGQ